MLVYYLAYRFQVKHFFVSQAMYRYWQFTINKLSSGLWLGHIGKKRTKTLQIESGGRRTWEGLVRYLEVVDIKVKQRKKKKNKRRKGILQTSIKKAELWTLQNFTHDVNFERIWHFMCFMWGRGHNYIYKCYE